MNSVLTSRSLFPVKVTTLSLLAHPYFELDIEQDEMYKRLLMNQETELLEWF